MPSTAPLQLRVVQGNFSQDPAIPQNSWREEAKGGFAAARRDRRAWREGRRQGHRSTPFACCGRAARPSSRGHRRAANQPSGAQQCPLQASQAASSTVKPRANENTAARSDSNQSFRSARRSSDIIYRPSASPPKGNALIWRSRSVACLVNAAFFPPDSFRS
jgi:hypothetical protein